MTYAFSVEAAGIVTGALVVAVVAWLCLRKSVGDEAKEEKR